MDHSATKPPFTVLSFFQVEKVLTGYPAHYGGLQPHDFLVSVQGQDIFDFNHKKTADLIKSAGTTMHITIERWVVVGAAIFVLTNGVRI